jgi:hypothetical protein
MIVIRLKIPLEQDEYSALLKIASSDLRNPVDQTRFILRQYLEKCGFLDIKPRDSPYPITVASEDSKHATQQTT